LAETGRGTLATGAEPIKLQLRAPCVALIRMKPAL